MDSQLDEVGCCPALLLLSPGRSPAQVEEHFRFLQTRSELEHEFAVQGPKSHAWRIICRIACIGANERNLPNLKVDRALSLVRRHFRDFCPREKLVRTDAFRAAAVVLSLHLNTTITPKRAFACFARRQHQGYSLTAYGEILLQRAGASWPPFGGNVHSARCRAVSPPDRRTGECKASAPEERIAEPPCDNQRARVGLPVQRHPMLKVPAAANEKLVSVRPEGDTPRALSTDFFGIPPSRTSEQCRTAKPSSSVRTKDSVLSKTLAESRKASSEGFTFEQPSAFQGAPYSVSEGRKILFHTASSVCRW